MAFGANRRRRRFPGQLWRKQGPKHQLPHLIKRSGNRPPGEAYIGIPICYPAISQRTKRTVVPKPLVLMQVPMQQQRSRREASDPGRRISTSVVSGRLEMPKPTVLLSALRGVLDRRERTRECAKDGTVSTPQESKSRRNEDRRMRAK